jgi:hypothetical protein
MKAILFSRICRLINEDVSREVKKRDFHNVDTLFFCIAMQVEKFCSKGLIKNYKKKNRYALTIISKEME